MSKVSHFAHIILYVCCCLLFRHIFLNSRASHVTLINFVPSQTKARLCDRHRFLTFDHFYDCGTNHFVIQFNKRGFCIADASVVSAVVPVLMVILSTELLVDLFRNACSSTLRHLLRIATVFHQKTLRIKIPTLL